MDTKLTAGGALTSTIRWRLLLMFREKCIGGPSPADYQTHCVLTIRGFDAAVSTVIGNKRIIRRFPCVYNVIHKFVRSFINPAALLYVGHSFELYGLQQFLTCIDLTLGIIFIQLHIILFSFQFKFNKTVNSRIIT